MSSTPVTIVFCHDTEAACCTFITASLPTFLTKVLIESHFGERRLCVRLQSFQPSIAPDYCAPSGSPLSCSLQSTTCAFNQNVAISYTEDDDPYLGDIPLIVLYGKATLALRIKSNMHFVLFGG